VVLSPSARGTCNAVAESVAGVSISVMPKVVSSTVSVSASSEADSRAGYCVTAEVLLSGAWISASTDSDSVAGNFVMVDVLMLVTLSMCNLTGKNRHLRKTFGIFI